MIEGSYQFSTGNDLNINWYHWNHSTNHSTVPAPGVELQDNVDFGTTNGVRILANNIHVSVKPQWDAINVEFAQHVDFGPARYVRFHGGVEYARLQSQSNAVATGISVQTHLPKQISGSLNLLYNGFGPRLGGDLVYGIGHGLGIYGKGAATLLVGSKSYKGSNLDNDPTDAGPYPGSSLSGSYTSLVPALEAKLGASYGHSLAQGDITLDIGWMWINYFNAQTRSFGGGASESLSFSLQGPYVGLTWLGNMS